MIGVSRYGSEGESSQAGVASPFRAAQERIAALPEGKPTRMLREDGKVTFDA